MAKNSMGKVSKLRNIRVKDLTFLNVQSIKKGKLSFPFFESINVIQRLTFRVLTASTSALFTVFFTLNHTRVTRNESGFFQHVF